MRTMKRIPQRLLGLVLAAVLLAAGAAEAQRRPDSFADLAKRLEPTVVNIQVTTIQRETPFGLRNPFGRGDPFEEFFRRFFGDQPPREFRRQGLGSGFIIDPEGYIVTNNHVVEKAAEIKVILMDRTEYKAKLIGRDPKTDLALLKIKPQKPLPATEFGDSDALRVGDWVMAVGNPFGFGHTVTAGIVSAKGRIIGQGPYDDFIQTDASINPGNSGGPLFNTEGRVVGINTAIIAGGSGIGFAIPANMAKRLIDQLRETGTVVRGFLGVRIQNLTPQLAKRFGLKKTEGALVADVSDNTPAAQAGVERGDVIIEYDGHPIKDINSLVRRVANTAVGKEVKMKVLRGGRETTLKVKVGRLSEEQVASAGARPGMLGLTLQELTPERARELGLKAQRGVLVRGVSPDSAAARAGIRPGDVVLEVNRQPVSDLNDLRGALSKSDEGHLFLVQRGDNKIYMVVPKG
ncbi:MAG: DegQ family serine endoprotease [Nitrospinota bacterium]